ncbi:MAG TPA: recombinase family protein [Candidatus Thermoplasmatota archaeon]|nr:recombinase family protein [Candidatus Thermoplasmatota archaeon]
MSTDTTRAVVYAAKSTTDDRGSIPTQLSDGRTLAERDGLTVVGEYSDEAASAFHGNRGPGLARAKAHAERIGAALVVQHSDRLARGDGATAEHLVELVLWARRAGVTLRSVQDPQTFDSMGLVYAALMGDRNHEDSARKSAAVKDGMRRRAQRGKLAGGPRPYGYRWVPELIDGRRVSHLEPVPGEAEVVRDIFLSTVNGMSQMAIARSLNERGVPPVRAKHWTQSSVRRVLTSPLYRGAVRHGDEEFPGAHEPLVTPELWRTAAEVRDAAVRTRGHGGGRRPNGPHLLTKGLLRCGRCGSALIPRSNANRRERDWHVYICDGRRVNGPEYCPQEPLNQAAVDGALLAELTRTYIDMDASRQRIAARIATDTAHATDALAQAEREAASATDRLRRVQRAHQDGHMEPADYAEQAADLRAQRKGAESAVEQAKARVAQVHTQAPALDAEEALLRLLADLRAAVLDGIGKAPNLDATRTLLRWLFRRMLYLAPGHTWLDMPGFITDDMPPVGAGYLLPDLNAGVVEWVNEDGTPYHVEAVGEPEPFNPDDPEPVPVIHRAVLPLDEQPLREGLQT